MFRKIGFGAAAALTVGLLAVGCSDDGDTFITSDIRPGNFPGGTVDENNLAPDRRAFTPADQDLENGEIFWNVTTREAIGIFVTDPVGGGNGEIMYAAYFDGTRWHTPVEISGEDADGDAQIFGAKVLWLNTASSTDPEARAHHGDAVIIFTQDDAAVPGDEADQDSNIALYGTFFDKSAVGQPASASFQGGFYRVASRLDDADVIDFDGDGFDDDPDVSAFGFVSDSLAGTHSFGSGFDAVDSGQPTTFVHVVWRQNEPDSADPTVNDLNPRYHSIPVDFSSDGNLLVPGAIDIIDVANDDADISESVSDTFVVHNAVMFWTVSGVDTGNSSDQRLMASVFGTGASSATPIELNSDNNSSESDDSNDVATLPLATNVYGDDHGLTSIYFLFEETGYGNEVGERNPDRDLMLGRLDIGTNGAITEAADSPQEIDGFTGLIDDTDGETVSDGLAVREVDDLVTVLVDENNGDVVSGSAQTRINRTGTAIFVLWLQDNTDLTDLDDSDEDIGVAAPNQVLFATVIQTRIDPSEVRTVAESFDAPQTDAAVLESDREIGGADGTDSGELQRNVEGVKFQGGLTQGQAETQAVRAGLDETNCNRGSSFQGNANRVSWLFTQLNDIGASDNNNRTLFLQSGTFSTNTTGAPSLTLVANAASAVDTVDDTWTGSFGDSDDYFAVDAGDNSLTTGAAPVPTPAAGRVLVFFIAQDTGNDVLDPDVGSFDEPRLFVSEQTAAGAAGTKTLVSTDPTGAAVADAFEASAIEDAILVPVNSDTVNAPHYVGQQLYVFWTERRVTGSGRNLVSRSRNQAAATTTGATLADSFVPPLPSSTQTTQSEDPVQLDNPWPGDLGDVVALRDGTTVGAYFGEDEHIFFSDASGDARSFDSTNGVPTPQLVDNDTPLNEEVDNYRIDWAPTVDGNNLRKSQAFWTKENSNGDLRAQIRVHN